MERAQRAADSPLRAILEAAKGPRPLAATSPPPVRAPAAQPPSGPAPAARPMINGNATVAIVDQGSPVITIRTLPTETVPPAPARSAALAPTAVAPLRGASMPALPPELPRPAALLPVASALTPQLLHMVEPEMTPRLLDQLTRPEVAVEFTIRPDGSVSDVRVQPPVPRALVPVIAAAVEQWRFAPLPAPHSHRVQLVFKPGG